MPEPTKKCWNCHVRLKLEDTECFSCMSKVGPPDKFGIAKKPFDWKSYVLMIIAVCGCGYYGYWLFFIK